jgi:hypothetical protein
MKRNIVISCAFFIFLLVYSCKKKPFDYRNKYTGNWNFKVYITELNTDSIGYYYFDSISYNGSIKYGEADDQIQINYTPQNSVTLTLSDKGELSNFPANYAGGEFFKTDNLSLYLKWGGLGGGTTHQIRANRK